MFRSRNATHTRRCCVPVPLGHIRQFFAVCVVLCFSLFVSLSFYLVLSRSHFPRLSRFSHPSISLAPTISLHLSRCILCIPKMAPYPLLQTFLLASFSVYLHHSVKPLHPNCHSIQCDHKIFNAMSKQCAQDVKSFWLV